MRSVLLPLAVISAGGIVAYLLLSDDDTTPTNEKKPGGLGASTTDCFGAMYGGGGWVSDQVKSSMNSAALATVTSPTGRNTWVGKNGEVQVFKPASTVLTPLGQVAAFHSAVSQLQSQDRSVPGLVTRDVLNRTMSKCDWNIDHDYTLADRDVYSKKQYDLWKSVWYLVNAAAAQVGFKVGGSEPLKHLLAPAEGGPGLIIGRGYLGFPDVTALGTPLPLGRRVEILVGDYTKSQLPRPPFFYAERLYGEVVDTDEKTNGPIIKIIGTFQGKDVAPKFADRHGFYLGRQVRLYGSGTTGIRRIFPAGVT